MLDGLCSAHLAGWREARAWLAACFSPGESQQ